MAATKFFIPCSGYFKIVCPYDSAREVENVDSCSLLGSHFPTQELRDHRPSSDLLRVAKKNWGWARYDRMHNYRRWKQDSPLRYNHETGKHALEVSAVSSKEEVCKAKLMNKVMLILFFVARGTIHKHIVPHHMTINALYCCEVLKILMKHVNKKRPNLKKKFDFCTTTMLSRTPLPSSENFWKNWNSGYTMYGHNLVPCDFWVFGALKWELRNR